MATEIVRETFEKDEPLDQYDLSTTYVTKVA